MKKRGKESKGLQKLTESKAKIDKILALEQITSSDLETLNRAENDSLMEILSEKINKLKGDERDEFCRKISPLQKILRKHEKPV